MTAVEIRSLRKRFGRELVLHDVSMTVERGQVYGLLGPNGSGKTTTLSCTLGLLRPSGGEARVLGEPSARIHRTRGRVGVVFDRAVLIPGLTARQNLEVVRRLQGHRGGRGIDEALEQVGMSAHARRRAGELSLGQAKRVSIAGALLGEPELLVLDEPLSGLDTLGARAMLRLFRRLAGEGMTLLLSSHRLHEMQQVVSHAAIVLGGRVARAGSLEELLERGSRRYELRVRPRGQAEEIARGFPGARVLESGVEGMVVELEAGDPAALNGALVRAGCEVERLAPVELDLQTVFERAVDEREAVS
jgi:ABC-2 type transport system ATP-binding protein